VVVAILIGAAALTIHGSFRDSSRVETVSQLLHDRNLWVSRVRLAGFVSRAVVKHRLDGVRFLVEDRNGTGRVPVDYTGETSDELRGGRAVNVTGTFDGHAFQAQPDTLVVICGRTDSGQHC
jgi:cytochrome c-type biogenesis protein CcmE